MTDSKGKSVSAERGGRRGLAYALELYGGGYSASEAAAATGASPAALAQTVLEFGRPAVWAANTMQCLAMAKYRGALDRIPAAISGGDLAARSLLRLPGVAAKIEAAAQLQLSVSRQPCAVRATP